jgi:hypothetical protein
MGLILRLGTQKAILRAGAWRSASPRLERELNCLTEEWIRESGGPEWGAEDPERALGEEMARRLGGKVAYRSRVDGWRPELIYLDLRQMKLPFE